MTLSYACVTRESVSVTRKSVSVTRKSVRTRKTIISMLAVKTLETTLLRCVDSVGRVGDA